jgi:hypothetical protein
MFPKSISDIDNADFDEFISTLGMCKFISDKIVVVSSARANDKSLTMDVDRFERIVEIFKSKGYSSKDNARNYTYFTDPGKAWASMMPGFSIPDSVVALLKDLSEACPKHIKNKKACKPDCATILNRWPILKVGTARFQLVRMAK